MRDGRTSSVAEVGIRPLGARHSRHPKRPVPTDLVGKCFNCLCSGHVAAACPNSARCLRCHREGHQARNCKRPWSLDVGDPPLRLPNMALVVVVNPRKGNIVLAAPQPMEAAHPTQDRPSCSATPSGMGHVPTPEVSSSCHVLPLLPPRSPPYPQGLPPRSPPPRSHPRPHCFELRVIPHTQAMDKVEVALANALVIMVGGNMLALSPGQILSHLSRCFDIHEGDVQVKRYSREDFLSIFASRELADRVLFAPPPQRADFILIFCRWNRQPSPLFKSFYFKVLL
jgi:hypothetical protein